MNFVRALVSVLALSTFLPAQIPSTPKMPKVTVAATPMVRVKQGSKAQVQVLFRVVPGFHINSNKPNSELLIPTSINWDVPTNISLAKTSYPPGEDYTFSFAPDEKLNVYTGDFAVKSTVMAAKSTPKGTYRVHATLRYQACDNRACYPPASVPFSFDVNVQKGTSTKTRRNPGQSPHIK
ncbi:MAG TPA: protein-disulfide reductase DsbD domain-containing protein [Terriglobales bacterium]|nr:protein-disulfide reductase DsbD domain-containing protein [Terriglobales bacterium]